MTTTATRLPIGRLLWTKDGSLFGNAIIYATEPSKYVEGQTLNLCETDFGNRMKLTAKEIDDHFIIGPERSYAQWLSDRADTLMNNNISDQCEAHDAEQEKKT
jgi:hypothetical protein